MTPEVTDPLAPQLPAPEQVSLRGGRDVIIRPIQPSDAPLLQAGYRRLSHDAIYFRFLSLAKELPAGEAARLATVDYQSRMAFVAVVTVPQGESLVGVARYEMSPTAPARQAQCAVVVGESYQRSGLGSALLVRLAAYARTQHIQTLVGTISPSNTSMLSLLKRAGFVVQLTHTHSGVVEVTVDLET